jgi:hypothetical protein
MKLNRCGRKMSWPYLKHFFSICLKGSRKATHHIGQDTKSMQLEPTESLIQRRSANCLTTSFSVMYMEIRILPANLHALCLPQWMCKKFCKGQIVTLYEYILLSIFKSQITVYWILKMPCSDLKLTASSILYASEVYCNYGKLNKNSGQYILQHCMVIASGNYSRTVNISNIISIIPYLQVIAGWYLTIM